MLSEDMDDVLREYYRWAQSGAPDDIGYPHVEPVRRLLGGSVRSLGLSDEEAGWVDAALGFLKKEAPDEHAVIEQIYKNHRSLRWLESRGHGDRRALALLASRGRQFVYGALFGAAIATKR